MTLPTPEVRTCRIVFGIPVATSVYETLYPELDETRMVPITSRDFIESRDKMADAIAQWLEEENSPYDLNLSRLLTIL